MERTLKGLCISVAVVLFIIVSPIWYVYQLFIKQGIVLRNEALLYMLSSIYGTEGCTLEIVSKKEMVKLLDDSGVQGFFSSSKKLICIAHSFSTSDLCDTFFHERRHAQQFNNMKAEYFESSLALKSGKVTYKDSWHETDARRAGNVMASRFLSILNRA